MSFRSRLTLFFVLIVLVPMVSLTVVLFRLIDDNESGKSDARLAARQQAATRLYRSAQNDASVAAVKIGGDVKLATALRDGDAAAAKARATQLLTTARAKRIVATLPDGRTTVSVGSGTATFPVTRRLTDSRGRALGTVQVSTTGPKAYAALVQRVTGMDVVVRRDGRTLASTLPRSELRAIGDGVGDVTLAGRTYRSAAFTARGFEGHRVQVALLAPPADNSGDVRRSRLLAGAILLGFFVLAFTFAVLVSRSLQRQIEGFLAAARRLGRGDFSAAVPTVGGDEFAALGEEFNRMSAQLEDRLEQLRAEQARLGRAIRSIGDSFASNLDRDAVFDIVVRTARDGLNADGARAVLRASADAPLQPVATSGAVDATQSLLATAEAAALESGGIHDAAADERYVLAHPLRDPDGGPADGTLAVVRAGRPFGDAERDLLAHLAGQAAVSLENVALHETVERQATTDELTQLANRRRFQETLDDEVERSRRFGDPVGLVMLDIDRFKSVNDTHGHQAGDRVLREVARVVRASCREIDLAARYGGEELAVILPGTDLDGAFNFAERLREAVGALVIETPDATLRVTASFGAATHPISAGDVRSLIASADAALYEAKRGGRNRTVRGVTVSPA